MKSRWLVNLALLVLVVGIAAALRFAPKPQAEKPAGVTVSAPDAETISSIEIDFPAKAPVLLEKRDGAWFLTKPYANRASHEFVGRLLDILHASSIDKFDANDPARFGLDHPSLKLKLGAEEFDFGTFNPVNGMQYVGYKSSVYLLATTFSEVAGTQVTEMMDKNLLAPVEEIAGFDFSRLEQWQEGGGLKLELAQGKWSVTRAGTHPDQNALKEWFADSWKTLIAMSVVPYKPDARKTYPSFEIKLKNGKTLHFDKQGESPELLLARPDEGLVYHFPQDVGFTILNPPVGSAK